MLKTVSGSFTRPADTTAYASGDLMANSTTAGSVTPISLAGLGDYPGAQFWLHRIGVSKSGTGVTTCSIRVHLYTSSPTVANGDNGAMSSTSSGWLGSFDVTITQAFSNGAAAYVQPTIPVAIRLASGQTLYALLEARSNYTPASAEVFTVSLETESA